MMVTSWIEQRSFIYNSISELPTNYPLVAQIEQEFSALIPKIPSTSGFQQITDFSTVFQAGRFKVSFGSSSTQGTGAIFYLIDTTTGYVWANTDNTLGQFLYQTFNQTDFDNFLNNYYGLYKDPYDFTKMNITEANPLHLNINPTLVSLWEQTQGSTTTFLLELSMPSVTYTNYGAPVTLWFEYIFIQNSPNFTLSAQLFNKTSTRMPESIWVVFDPITVNASVWTIDKIGSQISPLDFIVGGSNHLHGSWNGVSYEYNSRSVQINSPDVAVICAGQTTPFPTPYTPPDLTQGMSFNLYNNIWNTNYIMWYPFVDGDENLLFRFNLAFN